MDVLLRDVQRGPSGLRSVEKLYHFLDAFLTRHHLGVRIQQCEDIDYLFVFD
jgi:hypothetical protein